MVQAQRAPGDGLGRKEHQNGTEGLEFKDFIGISQGCKNARQIPKSSILNQGESTHETGVMYSLRPPLK